MKVCIILNTSSREAAHRRIIHFGGLTARVGDDGQTHPEVGTHKKRRLKFSGDKSKKNIPRLEDSDAPCITFDFSDPA
jgi:hypothetical protein